MAWNVEDFERTINATPAEIAADNRELQKLKIAHAESNAVDKHNLAANLASIASWADDPEFHAATEQWCRKHGMKISTMDKIAELIERETKACKARFAHLDAADTTLHLKDSSHLAAFKSGLNGKG